MLIVEIKFRRFLPLTWEGPPLSFSATSDQPVCSLHHSIEQRLMDLAIVTFFPLAVTGPHMTLHDVISSLFFLSRPSSPCSLDYTSCHVPPVCVAPLMACPKARISRGFSRILSAPQLKKCATSAGRPDMMSNTRYKIVRQMKYHS